MTVVQRSVQAAACEHLNIAKPSRPGNPIRAPDKCPRLACHRGAAADNGWLVSDRGHSGRGDDMLLELVSLVSTGLFAGAAVYVSLVEHPARVSCGTALALAEFRPAYRRGAIMQATLAAIGLVAGVGAWLLGHGLAWLVGGVLLGSIIPLTVIVIFPTNARLLDPALDPNSPQAEALLRRWALLHGIRSVLSLAAFFVLATWLNA